MPQKPIHEEQRILEIEKQAADRKRADESLRSESDKFQVLMDELAGTEMELLIKQLMSSETSSGQAGRRPEEH